MKTAYILLLSFLTFGYCMNVVVGDLRNKWKNQIKTGLMHGKHLAKLFQKQTDVDIMNQIYMMSNFMGVVDSMASFLADYDPETEENDLKKMLSTFIDVNTRFDKSATRRFGRQFREIYYELRDLEFSFKLLSKFLAKVGELKCKTSSDCREKIKWTFDLFRNDLDVKEQYSHILKSTTKGTEFSKTSLMQQVKHSSKCDLPTIFNFARNVILQLVKAEQIAILFGKITNKEAKTLSDIQGWADDMYQIRKHLFDLFGECGAMNNCTKDCSTGRCVKNLSSRQNICVCNAQYDGSACEKRNPISLTSNIISLMKTVSEIPKMKEIIHFKSITDYYISSMNCISLATETIQKTYSNSPVHSVRVNMYDLTPYYSTFLDTEYYIQLAKNAINCANKRGQHETHAKLLRVAKNLPRLLSKIHNYFCNKGNIAELLDVEPLFISFIKRHQLKACIAEHRHKIDNLWRALHLTQASGYVILLQVLYSLNRPIQDHEQQYQKQIETQDKCNKGITCQLPQSRSKVNCFEFYLLRNYSVEVSCEKQYKQSVKFASCENLKSVCLPCNCSTMGSISSVCNQVSGQCSCKDDFYGITCTDRDCKWSMWSPWEIIPLSHKKRYRSTVMKNSGNGKPCAGNNKEYIALPRDCSDLRKKFHRSGIFKAYDRKGKSFAVYCDMDTDGGGWTVFQRRYNGKVNFYRGWAEYENGFGNPQGEFWLGNSKLALITSQGHYELRVDLRDFYGHRGYGRYSTFAVGDVSTNYRLAVGGFSGTMGDSLADHNGYSFSAYDRDNDTCSINCASRYTGAWWYNCCYYVNLNGRYLGNTSSDKGMRWLHWKKNCMKTTRMMIRRKS